MAAAYKIASGITILLRYAPEAEVSAQHDIIYVGGPPPEEMNSDDAKWLETYGWSYSKTYDAWSHFA